MVQFNFLPAIISFFIFLSTGFLIAWAIRSLPGHESFNIYYLSCPNCIKGLKRRCNNSGIVQDFSYSIVSGLFAFFSFGAWGIGSKAIIGCFFSIACLIVIIIDLRYIIVPDFISINGCWFGMIYAALCSLFINSGFPQPQYYISFLESILGFVFIGGVALLSTLFIKEIGGGDIKLFGAIGACLGFKQGFLVFLFTSIIVLLNFIIQFIFRKFFPKRSEFQGLIPSPIYSCFGFMIVYWFDLKFQDLSNIFTTIKFPFLIVFLFYWGIHVLIHELSRSLRELNKVEKKSEKKEK